MSIRRNAGLAGLAAGCLLFLCLVSAARLHALDALVLAIVGGGVVTTALSWPRPTPPAPEPAPVTLTEPPSEPRPQFQAQPIPGIRLPSAVTDYDFLFTANVSWLPLADGIIMTSEIAVNDIVRRALQITERRNPGQAALIVTELGLALGMLKSDPTGKIQARADSIQLQLPPEDQQRLDEIATLRKEQGLWEFQRQHQLDKRRYLRTDVLKDPGSAVVWWLAKHEDQPKQVAESIDVLTQLARAANNAGDASPGEPAEPETMPTVPQTPAEHFAAFLDSLDPPPSDDARLLLTKQVARHVDGHDQKAADEMRRRHSGPDDDLAGRDWEDCTAEDRDRAE